MALRRRRGRKVWIFQTRIAGRTFTRSTGETDRKRAEAQVPRLLREVALLKNNPSGLSKLGPAIVEEVARIEEDVSASQATRVSIALMNFFKFVGDVPLYKIDAKIMEEYQRHRLRTRASSTVSNEVGYVLRILSREGFIVERTRTHRRKKTIVRALNEKELRLFFEAVSESKRLLFAFLLTTGARPAEVIPSHRSTHVALLKSDIDFDGGFVCLRCAKMRSGSHAKIRRLEIPEMILADLRQVCDLIPGDGHIFEPWHSRPRDFDGLLKRAGIEKVNLRGEKLTMHSFRHSYAEFVTARFRGNPLLTKAILGHSEASTIERYVHGVGVDVPVDELIPESYGKRGKP